MERRPALALAASVAVTVAFAAGAIVVNTGLLRHDHPKRVGKLDAQNIVQLDPTTVPAASSTAPRVRVIVVDETVPAPTAAPSPSAGAPRSSDGVLGSGGGSASGDSGPAATRPASTTPPAPSPAPAPPTTKSAHEDGDSEDEDHSDEPDQPEPTEPAEPIEGGHDDD